MKTTRKRSIRLTAASVRNLKTPGRYSDQQMPTLMLFVHGNGGRSWVQRIVHSDGVRRDHGLGGYPVVTLADARDQAFANRQAVHRGENPFSRSTAPTFAEAARQCLQAHKAKWAASTYRLWLGPLVNHAFPTIGDLAIDRINRQDVIRVLSPLTAEGDDGQVKYKSVARTVYKAIRTVFTWAQGAGHVETNVAADGITAALPALKHTNTTHRESVPYADIHAAMDTIAEAPASDSAKACLRLVILTGTRSTEAREAKWAEIDGDTWHIPAERMKARRPHAVPLSDAALAILEGQRGQHDTYIFPSPRKTGPLGKMGMSRLADRLAGSVHGMRSTFRVWSGQETEFDRVDLELCLSHDIRSAVERAYDRSDRLDKRRVIMQAWADYVAGR